MNCLLWMDFVEKVRMKHAKLGSILAETRQLLKELALLGQPQTVALLTLTTHAHPEWTDHLKARIHCKLMALLDKANDLQFAQLAVLFEQQAAMCMAEELDQQQQMASTSRDFDDKLTADCYAFPFANYKWAHEDLALVANHFRALDTILARKISELAQSLAYNPTMARVQFEQWLEPELSMEFGATNDDKPTAKVTPNWPLQKALERLQQAKVKKKM